MVEDIREGLERELIAERSFGWSILCNPTPAFRRVLLLAWGITLAQQAVGVDAIQYYLLDVIKEAGITSDNETTFILIGMSLIKLQCVFICSRMIDFQGRRFVIFLSLIGMYDILKQRGMHIHFSFIPHH